MSVQYVVDQKGKPRQVLLDIDEYEELLERAEDSEALAFIREFKRGPHEYVGLKKVMAGLDADVSDRC